MTEEAYLFLIAIVYRTCILLVGLIFAYMGYRLFLADKTASAGDFEASKGTYAMSLKGGAPGVFFCLFGTILICVSILKGTEYKSEERSPAANSPVPKVISNEPPVLKGN